MPFDPSQPSELVTAPTGSGFDPSQPSELVSGGAEAPPSPPDWHSLYGGLDGLDSRLSPAQSQAMSVLDRATGNPKEYRARAINQAMIQNRFPNKAPEAYQLGWEATKRGIAKSEFGVDDAPISDVSFYGLVQKRLEQEQKGEFPAWHWQDQILSKMGAVVDSIPEGVKRYTGMATMADTLQSDVKALAPDKDFTLPVESYKQGLTRKATAFWDSFASKPIQELPQAPGNLPDEWTAGPGGIPVNPAVYGGIYNSVVKPVFEGLETPFGLATMGVGSALHGVSKAYPLAKVALGGMSGLFGGMMAYETAKATPADIKVLKDPNSTTQQKVEAGGDMASKGLMALFGIVGAGLEFYTPKKAAAVLNELDGKTPAESAKIFTKEAEAVREESPAHSDFLMDAAHELDQIAQATPKKELTVPGDSLKGAQQRVKDFLKDNPEETPGEQAKTAETVQPNEQPAPQPAESAAGGDTAGIKNAVVDAEMKRMGLEESKHGEYLADEAANSEAAAISAADPMAGQKLVAEMDAKMRPASATEVMQLLREATRLKIERDAAERGLLDAVKAGDEGAIEQGMARVEKATADYAKTLNVADRTGTMQGQALAIRRRMMKEDYSLAALERKKLISTAEEKLTPEMKEDIKALSARLEELDAKLAEMEAKRPPPEPARQRAPGRKAPPNVVNKFISSQAEAARARIKERMKSGRVLSGIDPVDLGDHIIIGAEYIAKGITKSGEWGQAMIKEFGEAIRPHLEAIFEKAKAAQQDPRRLEAYKDRTQKRIDELKSKIAAGDYTKKPKPEPLYKDKAALRLEAEKAHLLDEFNAGLKMDEFKRSSLLNKTGAQLLSGYDALRGIITTGEFSFILRQGKFAAAGNPILTAKTLPNTFRAFAADPIRARAIDMETLNHPDFAAAKEAGVQFSERGSHLSKQDEMFMGRMIEKIPVVARFEQAARVFMNKLRLDLWRTMRDSSGGLNEVGQKQAAMFVNESTGRGGLGFAERAAIPLARVMFSPRFMASRMQMAAGHSLWGGDFASRKVIAKQYAKTLLGMGAYYTALTWALSDDEKKATVSWNPTSSDFGKIKVGNTRLDPLAGLAQVVVFASRLAEGETTNSRGKTTPLRGPKVPFGGDRASDVIMRFEHSKMHPVLGSGLNLLDGVTLTGQKTDLLNEAENFAGPMTYGDVYRALQDQDLSNGAIISLLAILGEGVQTYDANAKHPKAKPAAK